MKIISYNVNGIRAAINKGFYDWLSTSSGDVVCVQEIKALKEQVPLEEMEKLGYHHYWYSAEKKGYSGVAVFSKIRPDHIEYGCGIEQWDKEGRVIRADFGDLSVLNVYIPSGSSGDHRQDLKMQFLDDFYNYIKELRKVRPKLVVCGDYNICHKPIDIHDPVRNKKSSGFLPEERAWMDKWFESGFIDTFRYFHKEPHKYSWWSYRANARANNKGWRIDYNSATEPLKEKLVGAEILQDVKHSDHCPVVLTLD